MLLLPFIGVLIIYFSSKKKCKVIDKPKKLPVFVPFELLFFDIREERLCKDFDNYKNEWVK